MLEAKSGSENDIKDLLKKKMIIGLPCLKISGNYCLRDDIFYYSVV